MMGDVSAGVVSRLREISEMAPWLLPAAVAQSMVNHPDVPFSVFSEFTGSPSPRVTDESLRNFAKLASLGRLAVGELKAYIHTRFNALTFQVLTDAQVRELLEEYQAYGATVGPQMFAQHVRGVLVGARP